MDKNIPGEFVPLYVHYARDKAIRQAGEAAELMFIRGLTFCKGAKTHGLVPRYDLEVVGAGLRRLQPRVDALVGEGLWVPTNEGWEVKRWPKWNKTAEQLSEIATARRAAAIKGNHVRHHKDGVVHADCPHCQEGTP